ncbi:DUF6246 family protein [Enterobacter kobei]|uniref:DUF6246 family protein n=1 Tax=Enterobacter kobei TaxID=208224 RepID=UPI002DBC5335|nr:DUF6246 family protein [Enterobacter kobei]MEB6644300.1 DUF6246 family protein [Enterobacter kobei]
MIASIEIGEVAISDSAEGGKDYLLRPSFEAMMSIGSPEEIVQVYAIIHGSEFSKIISDCSDVMGKVPEWLSPIMRRSSYRMLFASMHVLQACCSEDLTPMIGEWKGWSRYVVYRPGSMSKNDIIVIAQHLMQHGISGKAKIRRLQRHESNETTTGFQAFEYISAARVHFGMPRAEASQLTMTEFQLLLASKYPDQKGFTREEYDTIADQYLAKQAARRAKRNSE